MTAPQPTPLMALRHASAWLGARQVLQGVTVNAMAGQWLAVVGPNGAGKSTLLRCLAGLLPVVESAAAQPRRLLRPERGAALAWLPQSPLADEAMTVHDTVSLGRLPHQGWWGRAQPSAADQAAVAQALEDTDLTWAAQRAMGELSGGERQRAALARALATQAPLLLLDEPAAHLDAPHQRLMARVLRRQARAGVCVVSVLHELPLALQADSLLVMQSGRSVCQGAARDPALHRQLEAVFEQAVRIAQVDGQFTAIPQL